VIEEEAVGCETAEIERGQLGDGLQQGRLLPWSFDARQGQVRRVRTLFFGDAERCERGFGFADEVRETGVCVDPGPENSGRMWVWEKAELFDRNGNRRARGQSGESGFQFLQPRLGPFADKLRGDVQVARRAPVDLSGGLEALEEIFEVGDDLGWEIDCGEETHGAKTAVLAGCGCHLTK